jgi:hypothetical protein
LIWADSIEIVGVAEVEGEFVYSFKEHGILHFEKGDVLRRGHPSEMLRVLEGKTGKGEKAVA